MSSTTTDPAAPGPSLVWLDPASENDWQDWREVRLAMLRDAPEAFGSTLADHRDRPDDLWRENLALPGMHTLVARDGGRPVAAARLVESGDDLPELISMYVAPTHRGTGLATRVVEAVVEHATERGHGRLHLHVMVGNPAARRAYERCGFEQVGEPFPAFPDRPEDPRVELRMERRLQSEHPAVGTCPHD